MSSSLKFRLGERPSLFLKGLTTPNLFRSISRPAVCPFDGFGQRFPPEVVYSHSAGQISGVQTNSEQIIETQPDRRPYVHWAAPAAVSPSICAKRKIAGDSKDVIERCDVNKRRRMV